VLGGAFSSRLNMNLREDKGWSYGAYSTVGGAVGPRPWMAYSAVQIDRTVDSLQEMRREISAYALGEAPASADEVERIRAQRIRRLPGSYETARSVLDEIGGIVRFDRPDDYVVQRRAEIEAMTPEQVVAAAATLQPATLTWVVVGDLGQIEAPIRELQVGEVAVVDADGNPVAGD